jgi:hypothetical protein
LVANYVLLALLIRVSDSSARRLGEIADSATFSERFATRLAQRRVRKHPEELEAMS